MFGKKVSLIFVLTVSVFFGAVGCSSISKDQANRSAGSEPANSISQSAPDKVASSEVTVDSNINESTNVTNSLITEAGGLGDTKEAIEKVRGSDELGEDTTFSSYQNNTISVMYIEDDVTKSNVAYNVTLQFESTDKVRRTKEEAIKEAEQVIPKDALKVEEYAADEGRDVILYESKLLAERLKGYYEIGSSVDPEAKPGTFIVILKHDDQGVFAVVTGPGNNP